MSGYYLITSRLSGLVLDVEKSKLEPGTRVLPWKRHGSDNQLWYDDPATGTIRSKLNGFCLDVKGDQLVLSPFQVGDHGQLWERHDKHIRNRHDNQKVLDVYSNSKKQGAQIGSYVFNGGANQSWDFEFVGGLPPTGQPSTLGPRRDFYIVSELDEKVLDIQGGSDDADAKIVTWTKSVPLKRNQLWYLDQQGYIRSALNNMTFQNSEPGDKLKTKPFTGEPRGRWAIDGKKIVNGLGECLDIKGEKKEDGAKLVSFHYKDSPNQHWRLEYV